MLNFVPEKTEHCIQLNCAAQEYRRAHLQQLQPPGPPDVLFIPQGYVLVFFHIHEFFYWNTHRHTHRQKTIQNKWTKSTHPFNILNQSVLIQMQCLAKRKALVKDFQWQLLNPTEVASLLLVSSSWFSGFKHCYNSKSIKEFTGDTEVKEERYILHQIFSFDEMGACYK